MNQLWGRLDLKPREARQLRTANVLLIYTIAFATLAVMSGLSMWVEYPDLVRGHFELQDPLYGFWLR